MDLLDDLLKKNPALVDEAITWYESECRRLGIVPLRGSSLPLRPFFIESSPLRTLTIGLRALVDRLEGEEVIAACRSQLQPEDWPLYDLHRSLPNFFQILRPDLIFDGEMYNLLELNVGAASSVTQFETDLLNSFYTRMFHSMSIDISGYQLREPIVAKVAESLSATQPHLRTLIAMMLPGPGFSKDLHDFGGQMLGFIESLERELKIKIILADPPSVIEMAHEESTGLFQMGMADMSDSLVRLHMERLVSIPGIERRWFTSPYTSLYEKTLCPVLSKEFQSHENLAIPESFPVTPESKDRLRLDRSHWVMKHQRNTKRILIGKLTPQEIWHDGAVLAAHFGEYVAQRHIEAQPTKIPVWEDGDVRIISVKPEFSPFMIDGELRSVFVRYLPDNSNSHVVSPPPKDLGLGVAWSF